MISQTELKEFLDEKYYQYNVPEFIESDPIQIPHMFSKKENIEISAFLTSTIAWGQRKTIIKNAKFLLNLMDNSPFDFVLNVTEKELKIFENFKHRTFNGEDCMYFIKSLQNIYKNHGGLQNVFYKAYSQNQEIKDSLLYFRQVFFQLNHPKRTTKHISNIEKKSAAKRLNLFLMWMIRNDNRAVHFELWENFSPSKLYIPLDVHCGNIGRKLNLLHRKQNDWLAVSELTNKLKEFDDQDPVKYDFALFGIGVNDDL
jgi:uncharacterized protein (TIGR02757 family)